MESLTGLSVWLLGLLAILCGVLAALTRAVLTDTMAYDKRFTWQAYRVTDEDIDYVREE